MRLNRLSIMLAVIALLPTTLSAADCNDKCGPDNNTQYDQSAFQTFTIPEHMRGTFVYAHSAECEQAIIFYDGAYNRIGRLGDLQSDPPGLKIANEGLPTGTYHVGGFMKYNNLWRSNKSKALDNVTPHMIFGWDDAGCNGRPADNDYDDSTLTIRLVRVRLEKS